MNNINLTSGADMMGMGMAGSDAMGPGGMNPLTQQDLLMQQLQQQKLILQQQQQQLFQSNDFGMDQINMSGIGNNNFQGMNNCNDTRGGMGVSLGNNANSTNAEMMKLLQEQQRQQMFMYNSLTGSVSMGDSNQINVNTMDMNNLQTAQVAGAAHEQLSLLHQMEAQQEQHQKKLGSRANSLNSEECFEHQDQRNQRMRAEITEVTPSKQNLLHANLLESASVQGNRLRSYYDLSINELLNLPPIPTDEDLCKKLPVPLLSAKLLPRFDVSAMKAARYAELALGAFVSNQMNLALELSNATVTCLRECVEEPVHPRCMFDVARAYFLHGLFRSYRGDIERYFKYRRVCLTHLHQMENVPGVEALLAAISFHDSWAYITHNADQSALPNIDDSIPRLPCSQQKAEDLKSKLKLGLTDTEASVIACNPDNQMWIQGPPPIFINNEAPPLSRSLDALACAVRTCCDQANNQFEVMAKAMNEGHSVSPVLSSDGVTPTGSAVVANERELCSRNMVLSAFTLLQQHESSCKLSDLHVGHHIIISAMDAFLGDHETENGGFSDSQVQSLLSVCNTVMEHPYVLHQPGPIYHMVSNAAILVVHLLNSMHANLMSRNGHDHNGNDSNGISDHAESSDQNNHEMEAMLFDETLDTFLSVRKSLTVHRRKLPAKLRCHGIPRPRLGLGEHSSHDHANGQGSGKPFIDLGETLMCGCRGCQGFVLMACSPCVAAERAHAANARQEAEIHAERDAVVFGGNVGGEENEVNEFDKELNELGAEFDLDDDALLGVLSRIIQS
jgi:hypothetical protein